VTDLQPNPNPNSSALAALQLELAAREKELSALKIELQQLQSRYLTEIGSLYAELSDLETAVAEEEIRTGVRPASLFDEDADDDGAETSAADPDGCIHRATPSVNLKKIFRDVVRAVHPDRAMDDRARYRRHSLMAEANRAYAEQDEDRLRLILRAWQDESDVAGGAEDDETRVRRRMARLGDRLVELDGELADVRASAIAGLKRRMDETAAQGWDLFGEMQRHVKREIARATARLTRLRRQPSAPSATASERS
jgi:hypothetical protein